MERSFFSDMIIVLVVARIRANRFVFVAYSGMNLKLFRCVGELVKSVIFFNIPLLASSNKNDVGLF